MGGDDARQGEDWAAVAAAVKARAAEKGLTQQDIATKAGVSLSLIHEIAGGKERKRPRRTLVVISRALDWPDDHLGRVLKGHPPAEGDVRPGDVDVQEELRAIREDMAKLMRRLDALGGRLEERP